MCGMRPCRSTAANRAIRTALVGADLALEYVAHPLQHLTLDVDLFGAAVEDLLQSSKEHFFYEGILID
jgi:hypothetical protein